MDHLTKAETPPAQKQESRKPYAKPMLIVLGDMRTLTLGGSPGCGDSGMNIGVEAPYGSASLC
ncbi:MAG: hypothetical protein Fur002_21400 [Anaerolineales bacterium]